MKYWILTWGVIALFAFPGQAQEALVTRSHKINREFSISYDNDFYFRADEYYTSGLNIKYSRLVAPHKKFYRQFRSRRQDSSKVIIQYHYGQEIYTPNGLRNRNVDLFDRPYAGRQYLRFYIHNFPAAQSMNRYGIGLGIVGKASGMANLQTWWHTTFNMPIPRGWDYQIANEPTLMLSYNRLHQWVFWKKFALLSNSGMQMGNVMNKLSQQGMIKFGKILSLQESGYSGNGLASFMPEVGKKSKEEFFFFYGVNADYIFTNMLIEGSLFNDKSPHTEMIEHFVLTLKWGVAYSNEYTTLFFTVCRTGSEIPSVPPQRYLNLNMAFRF